MSRRSEIGEKINVKVEIENNFDDKLDFDVEAHLYDLDSDESLDKTDDSVDIKSEKDETLELELEIPDDIDEFIKPLEAPPKSITIKYENVNLIDIDSCSACLSTIFNLLKNNKAFIDDHYTPEKPLNLAIGNGIKESDLYSDTFLIGNCTSNQKVNGTFIQGCTPVESSILKIIKEKLTSGSK